MVCPQSEGVFSVWLDAVCKKIVDVVDGSQQDVPELVSGEFLSEFAGV